MIHSQGFLVLCDIVARVSGLVAELRRGTRQNGAGYPTANLDPNPPVDTPSPHMPPLGARAGRFCWAKQGAACALAEQALRLRTGGRWQMVGGLA
jgi:hypothetical protein